MSNEEANEGDGDMSGDNYSEDKDEGNDSNKKEEEDIIE